MMITSPFTCAVHVYMPVAALGPSVEVGVEAKEVEQMSELPNPGGDQNK